MNIKEQFKINKRQGKNTPHYILRYKMDANDGDYVSGENEYTEKEWNELPDFFFLMIAYLGRGYSGKFSHGNSWGNYYGHHWEENKHGLREEIWAFQEMYEIVCHGEMDICHSYSGFDLEYYDEDNKQYSVTIPNIDNLFDTEAEMVKAIKDALKQTDYYDEGEE
jgi:hypothetical protein